MVTDRSKPHPQAIYLTAMVPEHLPARAHRDHPPKEGAQDLIIAAPDGRLYHVAESVWREQRIDAPPEPIGQLLAAGSMLAHIPGSASAPGGAQIEDCYLVNTAALNVDVAEDETPAEALVNARGKLAVYRVEESTWKRFVFRPGNSGLLLDMLVKGTTVAYVPKSARSTECMCYLLNLATLNGSTIFEMSHTESCEIPAK